jgi:hypothetical protein
VNTLRFIEQAFRHRQVPILFSVSEELAVHELDDVMSFLGKPWSSITATQLERHFEVVYWLTPDAFCYYLPGIFSAGIKENKPSLIVNHSLVGMLDRSPTPDSWDDFFEARWLQLTPMECEATQEWLLWLASFENSHSEHSLTRAFETLQILRERPKR